MITLLLSTMDRMIIGMVICKMIEDSNNSTINRVRVKGKGWDGTTLKGEGEGVRIEGVLEINTTIIITITMVIIITIITGITTIMVNLDRKITNT